MNTYTLCVKLIKDGLQAGTTRANCQARRASPTRKLAHKVVPGPKARHKARNDMTRQARRQVTTCGGINPYTLTAGLGPGGLAHYETSSKPDPTAQSFAQGNKAWRSSRNLVG